MWRVLLALMLWSLGRVSAQTNNRWLHFDLGLAPLYVDFTPVGTDNWSGSRPSYATMVLGSVDLGRKDKVGLGGGAFFWGDHILFPVYAQIKLPLSELYRDTTKVSAFVRRLSIGVRCGTMLGKVETIAGKLRPQIWYDASIVYRISNRPNSSIHIGAELGLFSWKGPYELQTTDSWEERRPQILTIGPLVQFRF